MARHEHKDDISTKSGNLDREGLGWHRGCQEVANHSEGLEERGEGWHGTCTKTKFPRKVANHSEGLGGGVARHDTRSATATVTWTARRGDVGSEGGAGHTYVDPKLSN